MRTTINFLKLIMVLVTAYGVLSLNEQENYGLTTRKPIGGRPAKPGQAPWQVSLVPVNHPMLNYNFEEDGHFCSGSLIGKRTVITTAHCVSDFNEDGTYSVKKPNLIKVKYDGLNRRKLEIINKVTRIFIHPKFVMNDKGFDFDFAILLMRDQIIESPTVKIVNISEGTLIPGNKAILTGWSATNAMEQSMEMLSPPIMLQANEITILQRAMCNELRKSLLVPPISERFICARNSRTISCNVDSGGPLVYKRKLVGIASFTTRKCEMGGPTFFSDPTAVRRWIDAYRQ